MSSDIDTTVTERGGKYGPPRLHFPCTVAMFAVWQRRRDAGPGMDGAREAVLWHAVYMICDKLARAAQSPDMEDHWRDIQGYSECARRELCGQTKETP